MTTNTPAHLTFADIFDGPTATTRTPLDVHVEQDLITAAREERKAIAEARATHGSRAADRVPQPALRALIWQYIPWLRGRAADTAGDDIDEARANAMLGFLEALDAVPDDCRLVVRLDLSARQVTDQYRLDGVAPVPASTRKRYLTIYRAADYDVRRGLDICEQHGMTTAVYQEVTRALFEASSTALLTEDDEPFTDDAIGAFEDAAEITVALRLLADLGAVENRIVRRYYGLDDYTPQSDVEIAETFKREAYEAIEAGDDDADGRPNPSRQTVTRKRERALKTMHLGMCSRATHPRCDGSVHDPNVALAA